MSELDDLKNEVKRKLDGIVQGLKDIDMEKETINFLRETEKGLDSISRTIERKRSEMESEGVERTVRKDAAKVIKGVNRALDDLKKRLDPDDDLT